MRLEDLMDINNVLVRKHGIKMLFKIDKCAYLRATSVTFALTSIKTNAGILMILSLNMAFKRGAADPASLPNRQNTSRIKSNGNNDSVPYFPL